MARLLGVDIPDNKRVEIALTYIHGIGPAHAATIMEETGIDPTTRTKDLTEDDFAKIRSSIDKHEIPVEGELRRIVSQNIRRLQDIRCYRGERHKKGLPVRGQRTNSNARTRKGKRKTIGNVHKKAAAHK